MKKIFGLLGILILSGGIVFANYGFQDNNAKPVSISEALKMNHNSYVTVQGSIEKRLTSDEYLFKDSTGSITVEIDDDKWMGQAVTINDKLELKGEIEKKFNTTKLDVDSVKKLAK